MTNERKRDEILKAFRAEAKAAQVYDTIFASFSDAERSNIQKTLIDILYLGNNRNTELLTIITEQIRTS